MSSLPNKTVELARQPKILQLGCGAVGTCLLGLIGKAFANFDYSKVTIVDQRDCTHLPVVKHAMSKGAKFEVFEATKENTAGFLASKLTAGDLLIDLTCEFESKPIILWCKLNGVMYINTSVEFSEDESNSYVDWISPENTGQKLYDRLYGRTLYVRNVAIRNEVMIDQIKNPSAKKGPTAILEHGANPGIVSQFTKYSLEQVAKQVLDKAAETKTTNEKLEKLAVALKAKDHANLAYLLGMKVLHVSERDNQITDRPKKVNEFCNTWSALAYAEEASDPIQVCLGTHDKHPAGLYSTPEGNNGPRNHFFLATRALNIKLRSCVAGEQIVGGCIPHSETMTISEYLTVYKNKPKYDYIFENGENSDENIVYRPSSYYVYMSADVSVASLQELQQRDYEVQDSWRVLTGNEVVSGYDKMGVLLIFEKDPIKALVTNDAEDKPWCWWCGSILSVEQAALAAGIYDENGNEVSGKIKIEDRRNYMHFNATVTQVAASACAAVAWMLTGEKLNDNDDGDHQTRGIIWPEKMDHEYIISVAKPFLGEFFCQHVQWDKCPKSLQYEDFWMKY